jgi:hypothetical protein
MLDTTAWSVVSGRHRTCSLWAVNVNRSLTHVDVGAWCPSCPVGRQARDEFWAQDAGYYAAVLVLPFVLVAVASLRIARLLGERDDLEG